MFLRAGSRIALFFIAVSSLAQTPTFSSLPSIPFDSAGPVIRAHSETEKPFTVAGERGVVLGQQNGTFEAWVLPVKLLSHLTIEADIEGYTVPIDVNEQAAAIEVRPDRTIITYSHIGFTVRQIMFSPNDAPTGTGPVVLFEFDCIHPTEFILRFTPELRWMWPARNEGVPGVEWVAGPNAAPTAKEPGPSGSISGSPLPNHGYYVLHADYPDLAGAITIPGAQPGILAPYQERPQVHPVEFHLHINPARDHGRLFPLLMAAGMNKASATNDALGATLSQLNTSIATLYTAHAESYAKLLANSTSIKTPDHALDEAFQWAVVSVEQLRAHPVDAHSEPTAETALVAGYYASGDSARPGFGWFFGRDALYTLFAVNGYGDLSLSKSELEFLIQRQRADGKIMHEYSQTAAAIDWQAFPYMYAAADSTPLFLLAVADYVRSSGDVAFLTAHRDAVEKAWAFETDPAHDTDHDGIYDNSQGTGWVESWPGGMPHQEIYLALLDQQASAAMGYLEDLLFTNGLMKDRHTAVAALRRSENLANIINSEYYDPQKHCYAFSRNMDGSLDRTSTVYPALAWWSDSFLNDKGKVYAVQPQPPKTSILEHPDGCLSQLAGHTLNTDWGLRDVANDEKIYDGTSYHQGSVWPLFTGWAALAEYRGNQPLAGYQILMENVNLTKAQDLGAVTELLSGDFFVPFGRSTSHQLWSSAMVITPTLRGLFGIDIDAQTKTITVNPHLPASWDNAEVSNLRVGGENVSLSFVQNNNQILIHAKTSGPSTVKLSSMLTGAKPLPDNGVSVPRPAVEVGPFFRNPLPGDRTQSVRVLNEEYGERKLTLSLEGPAGEQARLPLFVHALRTTVRAEGAELATPGMHINSETMPSQIATINFPEGEGWKTVTVTLTW